MTIAKLPFPAASGQAGGVRLIDNLCVLSVCRGLRVYLTESVYEVVSKGQFPHKSVNLLLTMTLCVQGAARAAGVRRRAPLPPGRGRRSPRTLG